MNQLLTILAGTCLLVVLSQQLIGAEAQEEVTSASPVPTVAGESTTTTATKDDGDSSEEDKPKVGKGHGCLGGFMGGKGPGAMKSVQKKPMGDFPKFADKMGPGMQKPTMKMPMGGFGQKKPDQVGIQGPRYGGHQGPMGGFGGNQPAAMGAGTLRGPGAMRHPTENKPQ